jgi:Outer membrane protein beta-barrel domain
MTRRFIALLLALPLAASAQLYVGPTVGTRLSTVTFFEDRAKHEFRSLPAFGLDAGFMVSKRIKDHFLLNIECIYSNRGKNIKGKTEPFQYNFNGQVRVGNPDPLYRNRQRNHYIELPISYLLEFKNSVGKESGMAGQQKSYKWFIGAGPTVSFWMGGRGKLESSWLREDLIDELGYGIVFKSDSIHNLIGNDKMFVANPRRFQFALNFTGGVALEPVGLQKVVIAAHLELGQSFIGKRIPEKALNGEPEDGYFPGSNVDRDALRAKYHSLRFSVSYIFDTKIENRKRGKSTIKNKSTSKKKK